MLRVSLTNREADKLVPLFGGFCFFLSVIELTIPKPLPFFRIGLANLPILMGIDIFSFPAFFLLLIVKILGQAFISGTLFSYIILFSALGTICSGLLMYSLKNIPRNLISFIGISIIGAFVSNSIQFLLAIFIIFGKSAVYIIPPMFAIGIATSAFFGFFVNLFTETSIWYESVKNGIYSFNLKEKKQISNKNKREKYLRLGSGLVLILLLLFTNFLPIKTVIFGVSLILCIVDKNRINFVNVIVLFIAIVFFNLFPPSGKIIFSFFDLNITNDALVRGIEKAVIFESLIYLSKWMLKTKINLKGTIGEPVSAAFCVFNRLFLVKNEFDRKNIIRSLDSILLSIDKGLI